MRYQGEKMPIRIGRGALMTDLPPSDIPDTHLLEALNVIVGDGTLQKETGSRRWNRAPLSSGIVDFIEWYPTDAKGYIYVITKDGKIWRYENWESVTQITAETDSDPSSLVITGNDAYFVEGGEETPGNDKKLFIFSGNQQIQVISAAETTYTSISTPSADFNSSASKWPYFGVAHQGRLIVFLDHRAYISTVGDHEDFTGAGSAQYPVYPGEGDKLISAFIYKKALFAFKLGGGVYQLIDTSASTSEWYFTRISREFGAAAHGAAAEVINDLLIANDSGTITSLQAVDRFGDIDLGDTFNILKVKRFLEQQTSNTDLDKRRMLYHSKKQFLYTAYRPADSNENSGIWKMDFTQQNPNITVIDKDQVNCFGLLTIPRGQQKPFYGADDGYLYEMDCEDREVGLVHNPVACTAALGSGAGSLDNASYRFRYSFADGSGNESLWSAPTEAITVSDNGVNGKIELTFVQTDQTSNATKRIIYGKKSTDDSYTKVAEIGDNTTTTYTVNSDPATWTSATEPAVNSFNSSYTMRFQVPHLTGKHVNPALDGLNKHWDFVEIAYLPQGDFTVSCEYWIDGIYKRSRDFIVDKSPLLDDFELDVDRLDAGAPRYVRFKLHGSGNAVSFRFSATGQNQNVIITDIKAYFRLGNEDQKAVKSGKKAS